MATITSDVHDALVHADVDATAAAEILRRLDRRAGPSSDSTLATGLGFMLLTAVFGRFLIEAGQRCTDLRTAIAAAVD